MGRPIGIESELKSIEFVPPVDSKSYADKIMKEKKTILIGREIDCFIKKYF